MTDKFKEYIKDLATACLDITQHSEYKLHVNWSKKAHEEDDEYTTVKMTVLIDEVYLSMIVTVYPEVFSHWEDKEYQLIGEFMMHEICHAFIKPVQELFMWDISASQEKHVRGIIERQTQRICNAICGVLREDWYMPKVVKTA